MTCYTMLYKYTSWTILYLSTHLDCVKEPDLHAVVQQCYSVLLWCLVVVQIYTFKPVQVVHAMGTDGAAHYAIRWLLYLFLKCNFYVNVILISIWFLFIRLMDFTLWTTSYNSCGKFWLFISVLLPDPSSFSLHSSTALIFNPR